MCEDTITRIGVDALDLRLYTKSGNDYYVDISEYDYKEILKIVTDAMDRGDILTLENNDQVDVIHCRELEYFEIIRGDAVGEEIINKAIGFTV